MIIQDLPFYKFFTDGDFITKYSENILDSKLINEKYHRDLNISNSAKSLLSRFERFVYNSDCSMLEVWSEETLINIIMIDRKYLERELINRGENNVENLDQDEIINLYFNGEVNKNKLIDLIKSIIETEEDLDEDQEFLIGFLMSGLFYFPNWYRYDEENKFVKTDGNFQYLSDEDINKLKILYGISKEENDHHTMLAIGKEQHFLIKEIIDNDVIPEEYISLLSKLIQLFRN